MGAAPSCQLLLAAAASLEARGWQAAAVHWPASEAMLCADEQLDAAYQEVKDVVAVPRGLGFWGDMVVTLRNNDKMELRSLPQCALALPDHPLPAWRLMRHAGHLAVHTSSHRLQTHGSNRGLRMLQVCIRLPGSRQRQHCLQPQSRPCACAGTRSCEITS